MNPGFSTLLSSLAVFRQQAANPCWPCVGTSQESLATSSSTTWKSSNACLFSACRTRPTHRLVWILPFVWRWTELVRVFYMCSSWLVRYVPWPLGQQRPLFLQMKETPPCWSNSLTCFLASCRYTRKLSCLQKCHFESEDECIVVIGLSGHHLLPVFTDWSLFQSPNFTRACGAATLVPASNA